MSTSLSSPVDNLSEIYKKECKGCEERRNIKSVCKSIGLKNNKLSYECDECKKRKLKPINGLVRMFPNIHQFHNEDINKPILLLRKGVYPYEYMDSWEKFEERSLPDKKALKISLIKTTNMLKKCLKNLNLKTLLIITTCIFNVMHYCLQMYLKTLEAKLLKYMNLILLMFCLHLD